MIHTLIVGVDVNFVWRSANSPVILVTPPSTAAAPTMAYRPGVMQSSPVEHSPEKIQILEWWNASCSTPAETRLYEYTQT